MTLEEKIKHYRKQAGLSQEKMAEKIGVSRQAITKWENGTGTPDIANLMAIADLFQISVDELLSNEKSEKKQSNYIYESRTEYDIDGKKNFDIKQVGMPLYKGVIMTGTKFLLGVIVGLIVGKICGPQGFLGIAPFVLIAAITNSNGSLYISLSSQFGNATDTGAISILSLNDGPFFTLIALGATGLANIPIKSLIAVLVPLLIGFFWGNLDKGFRDACKTAQPIVTFFMTISIGAKTDVKTILTAGASGIVLGLISAATAVIFFFVINLLLPKKERNAMGAAIGTTALNSAMTPAAKKEINKNQQEVMLNEHGRKRDKSSE